MITAKQARLIMAEKEPIDSDFIYNRIKLRAEEFKNTTFIDGFITEEQEIELKENGFVVLIGKNDIQISW